MTRPRRLALLLFVTFAPHAKADDFAYFHENVLGTSMELRVRADSPEAAGRAEAAALAEIDRLAKVSSGYDLSSEFRRWLDRPVGAAVKVSPELLEVFQGADHWMASTAGAFDPRVQIFSALWANAAKEGRPPAPSAIGEALGRTAKPAWAVDAAAGTVTRASDAPVSFNSIAKGHIVDRASEAALKASAGVSGVMLSIGGDLRVRGDMAREVGVANPLHDSETTAPLAGVRLREKALGSSGNYQRGFRVGGVWHSHIIDPRTGTPAGKVVGATVVADRAADASALATAFSVLPISISLKLADSFDGVACLLVSDDGRVSRSARWAAFETPRPVRIAFAPEPRPTPAAAAEPFEVLVKYEIMPTEGLARRYRRPYLAIWVEDKDGVSVRTLALFLQKNQPGPRWFPDLKRWYKADQVRKLVEEGDLIQTVARATRPPGQYEVIWDGKDDHGKPVGPGEYTLSIEAAREHGTYQVIRKPLNVGGKPFREELKGNAEIKSASVEYRPAPAAR